MFTRQKAMLLPSLALFSVVAFAQQTEIRGRITDSGTAAPIVGASLVVKGTTIATKTNEKGEFVLQTSGNQGTLEISYVGYASQAIAVAGRKFLDIQLAPTEKGLDEVVVTGYQTERRRI